MTAARIALAVLISVSLTAHADQPARWRLAPGSRLSVDGDSTFHKYRLDTSTVEVTFTVDDATAAAGTPAAALAGHRRIGVALRIPVAALHSGESGLDQNARKALHADRFADIAFRSTSIAATPAGGGVFALQVAGTLTIAGTSRPIAFDARATPAGPVLRIAGQVPLRMTDFGIKPPRFMSGMMKVADPIRVTFDLSVAR